MKKTVRHDFLEWAKANDYKEIASGHYIKGPKSISSEMFKMEGQEIEVQESKFKEYKYVGKGYWWVDEWFEPTSKDLTGEEL
jgi:tRNA U34 2-thiouridine synthase MnmA/TrmU